MGSNWDQLKENKKPDCKFEKTNCKFENNTM